MQRRGEIRNRWAVMAASASLLVFVVMAVLAGFIAPYSPRSQDRRSLSAPPTALHWMDGSGHVHWQPFVIDSKADEGRRAQGDAAELYHLRLLSRGEPYLLLGWIPSSIHLFGVADSDMRSDARVNLLGTDPLGRDILSRLVYGAGASVAVAAFAFASSLFVGLLLGGASGLLGRSVDLLLMRLTELLMSIPPLLLVLPLRAALPLEVSEAQSLALTVLVLSVVAWPEIARLVRNAVLSLKNQMFVESAIASGGSFFHILRRHILPNALTPALIQATVLVPSFILSEAALSFLGLGVREPSPSWGNMLAPAMDLSVLKHHPWMLAPGVALFLLVFSVNLLAHPLRTRYRL
ncbi:MAG: ABC transporter permease [Acidobacteria bacterium]|nr:ABC transporter permease [Acidobacteriota bacterium]